MINFSHGSGLFSRLSFFLQFSSGPFLNVLESLISANQRCAANRIISRWRVTTAARRACRLAWTTTGFLWQCLLFVKTGQKDGRAFAANWTGRIGPALVKSYGTFSAAARFRTTSRLLHGLATIRTEKDGSRIVDLCVANIWLVAFLMIKPMAFLALYKLISRGYIQATIAKKAKKKESQECYCFQIMRLPYLQITQWRSNKSWAKSSASIKESRSSLFRAPIGDPERECRGELGRNNLKKVKLCTV